jgi:hypothetical protein
LVLARNYRNPDDPEHRIISYLYKVGRADIERISNAADLTPREASHIIRGLKGIVAKE